METHKSLAIASAAVLSVGVASYLMLLAADRRAISEAAAAMEAAPMASRIDLRAQDAHRAPRTESLHAAPLAAAPDAKATLPLTVPQQDAQAASATVASTAKPKAAAEKATTPSREKARATAREKARQNTRQNAHQHARPAKHQPSREAAKRPAANPSASAETDALVRQSAKVDPANPALPPSR